MQMVDEPLLDLILRELTKTNRVIFQFLSLDEQ
jgi:hypothetical protein